MAERRGLNFGFAIAGVLGATLAYLAVDYGLFDGPSWIALLVAGGIGISSGLVTLAIDRLISSFSKRERAAAVIKHGNWGCPSCGAAYNRDVATCSDCGVALVEAE